MFNSFPAMGMNGLLFPQNQQQQNPNGSLPQAPNPENPQGTTTGNPNAPGATAGNPFGAQAPQQTSTPSPFSMNSMAPVGSPAPSLGNAVTAPASPAIPLPTVNAPDKSGTVTNGKSDTLDTRPKQQGQGGGSGGLMKIAMQMMGM